MTSDVRTAHQRHKSREVVLYSPDNLVEGDNDSDEICFVIANQRVVLSRHALIENSAYFSAYLRNEAKDSREIAIRQARPGAVIAALHICAYKDDTLFWQMVETATELWSAVQEKLQSATRNTQTEEESKDANQRKIANSTLRTQTRIRRNSKATLLSPLPQPMTIVTTPTRHTRHTLMSPLRKDDSHTDMSVKNIHSEMAEKDYTNAAELRAARKAHKHALRDLLSFFQSCLRFELRAHAYLTAQAIVDQLDTTNVRIVWNACEGEMLANNNSESLEVNKSQPVLYIRQACTRLMQPGLVSTPPPPQAGPSSTQQQEASHLYDKSECVTLERTPSTVDTVDSQCDARLQQMVSLLAKQAKSFHDELQRNIKEHKQALQDDFDSQVASIEKVCRDGKRELQKLEDECMNEKLKLHEATLLHEAEARELAKDEEYEQQLEAYWHAMERTRESVLQAMRVLQASKVMSRNEREALRHTWLQLIEDEESKEAELAAALNKEEQEAEIVEDEEITKEN